jgi:predicted nucleic acid-binding protein
LLIDDGDGIRSASAAGINVIRTPGIYRLAKERRLIPAVRLKLDDLRCAGFWLRDEHYRMILKSLGEL